MSVYNNTTVSIHHGASTSPNRAGKGAIEAALKGIAKLGNLLGNTEDRKNEEEIPMTTFPVDDKVVEPKHQEFMDRNLELLKKGGW